MGSGGGKEVHHHHTQTVYQTPPEVIQKLEEQDRKIKALEELKRGVEIASAEDYDKVAEESFQKLCSIASDLKAGPLPEECKTSKNIGLIGPTSSGKSSLTNVLVGRKVALTGKSETTMEVAHYPSEDKKCVFWDFPGKNDKTKNNYYSDSILRLCKGFDKIALLFSASIRECTDYLALVKAMRIPFVCVFTKTDDEDCTSADIDKARAQVEQEVRDAKDFYQGFFAISTRNPDLNQTRALLEALRSG